MDESMGSLETESLEPESLDLESLDLGVGGPACTTCGTEIDLPDDRDDIGLCRHCGLAFSFEPAPLAHPHAS